MHTKKLVKLICGLSVLIIISGCASTVQYVPLPDQTKKIEDPNKARIYVARPTSFGSAIPINISDGGKLIGHTGPNGYLCWERDPGKTELKGKAENTSTLTLNMEKGTVYYVQQHINMGFFIARNKLRQMIDDEGEKKVAKCKSPTVNSKLSSTSFAQFGAGIKTISGTISFTKNSYDGDDYTSILKIAPSFGYFLFENLAVNISIDKRTSFYPKDWDRDSISSTNFGIGTKYYVNTFYSGCLFNTNIYDENDAINSLLVESGYLVPFNDNVFLDIGIDYSIGLGDNKLSSISFGFGIATFF